MENSELKKDMDRLMWAVFIIIIIFLITTW